MNNYVADWHNSIDRKSRRSGVGRNKLRTYRLFKTEYETENDCRLLMPNSHHAAFAKLRCGVAPIQIETGRFENLDVTLVVFDHAIFVML